MANSSKIRIGTIENAGPNNLVSYLRNAGSVAKNIDIAVAFITAAGLDSLLYMLQRAASRGQVRILTGLYQGFTDPKALRMLLREQQESNGSFKVHISTDQHFHWKSYFLLGKTKANVVIGSSNLTDDGLNQSGEFNAVLTFDKSSKQFRDIHDVFERQWQTKSASLSEKGLRSYERWRSENYVTVRNTKVPLREILKLTRETTTEKKEQRTWRTWISGHMSSETESVLRQTTDWDKRGLSYFSTWNPTYQEGDQVILFDSNDMTVMAVQILERTFTPQRTPDGRHFAAYRKVRGVPLRKLTSKRFKMLKRAKLLEVNADAYLSRKLSSKQFQSFVDNLKEVAK